SPGLAWFGYWVNVFQNSCCRLSRVPHRVGCAGKNRKPFRGEKNWSLLRPTPSSAIGLNRMFATDPGSAGMRAPLVLPTAWTAATAIVGLQLWVGNRATNWAPSTWSWNRFLSTVNAPVTQIHARALPSTPTSYITGYASGTKRE